MIDQVAKLKQMAIDKYDEDGGTMFECTDDDGYRAMIAEYGTAKAAWKAGLGDYKVREAYAAECRAAYDY